MIQNNRDKYPGSVVKFVDFSKTDEWDGQQWFNYLQEREAILQAEVERYGQTPPGWIALIRLREIEAHLIWLAHNASGERAQRIRGRGY